MPRATTANLNPLQFLHGRTFEIRKMSEQTPVASATRTLQIMVASGVLSLLAVLLWHWGAFSRASTAEHKGVPVRVIRAARNDTPAYLTNIATVQAFNT